MGTASSGRDTGTIGVLELGTNSLKLHLHCEDQERCEPSRVEWDVGHEIDSARCISLETIDTTLVQIRKLLLDHRAEPSRDSIFGIATGAFREAENTAALLERLSRELGIPGRILTAEQEASLLAEGAGSKISERPGMVFDLGGGTLELVHLGTRGAWLREDYPLGAIHIHVLGSLSTGVWDHREAEQRIIHTLRKARAFKPRVLHGTGGTVKAIAQVAGREEMSIEAVYELEERTRTEGPPRGLSPRRRELFHPGLLVVRHLLERVGAEKLRYTRVDLGEILLLRLRPVRGALRGPRAGAILLQALEAFPAGGAHPLAAS